MGMVDLQTRQGLPKRYHPVFCHVGAVEVEFHEFRQARKMNQPGVGYPRTSQIEVAEFGLSTQMY